MTPGGGGDGVDAGNRRSGGILVVDDDREMVRTIADILHLRGWDVTCAHSGEEAVDAVDAHRCSIVLMDIRMKGMTGVEALRRIRARRPGIRVVLMTAYTTDQLIEEARREGVVDILAKPLAVPRLMKLLDDQTQANSPGGPVLVVDDDREFLRALCDSLEEHGVRTRQASHLHEALALLEEVGEIQVAVLDLQLDRTVDADTVLAIQDARPEVLVILFSGYHEALEDLMSDLPEGSVVAALAKPFDPARLIRILERVHDA